MYWQLHSGKSNIFEKINRMICVSIRFSFNWKTIIEYVAAHCIILVYSLCMIQIISCTINLLIGFSLLLNAITKDIIEDLISMDKNGIINQNPVPFRENSLLVTLWRFCLLKEYKIEFYQSNLHRALWRSTHSFDLLLQWTIFIWKNVDWKFVFE